MKTAFLQALPRRAILPLNDLETQFTPAPFSINNSLSAVKTYSVFLGEDPQK